MEEASAVREGRVRPVEPAGVLSVHKEVDTRLAKCSHMVDWSYIITRIRLRAGFFNDSTLLLFSSCPVPPFSADQNVSPSSTTCQKHIYYIRAIFETYHNRNLGPYTPPVCWTVSGGEGVTHSHSHVSKESHMLFGNCLLFRFLMHLQLIPCVSEGFCKTQPPASIGWVALSSLVCRLSSVPHCNISSYLYYMMFQTIQTIYFL